DLASLLDLYGKIRTGKPVRPDDTNPLLDVLRLSGVVRLIGNQLTVRNRIYERVFDREWVTQHMPDAELRRQQAAFRRGLVRASTVFAAILMVVGSLAVTTINEAHLATVQRHRAEEREKIGRRDRYAAQINLAYHAWEDGDVGAIQQLLDAQLPKPGQEDLRGFEWRYLWRLCRQEKPLFTFTFPNPTETAVAVAFS